jgi:hypothetical protein
MTREDIVRMAKEAGMESFNICVELDDFAKLVAQHEREKFCAVLRQLHDSYSLMSDSSAIRARG